MQLGLDFNLVEDLVAGVDEVGRGPLCGPVVTAAVILDPSRPILGLNDSKKLSEARREALFEDPREGPGLVHRPRRGRGDRPAEHSACHHARHAARGRRPQRDSAAGPDRRQSLSETGGAQRAGGQGDSQVPAIAAASILAKVSRDREMVELDRVYPGYGMAGHKGYPTAVHLEALSRLGPTPIHRRSFAPVRELLDVLFNN